MDIVARNLDHARAKLILLRIWVTDPAAEKLLNDAIRMIDDAMAILAATTTPTRRPPDGLLNPPPPTNYRRY